MRRLALCLLCGLLIFTGYAVLMPDEADARGGGFRASSRGFSRAPRVRMGLPKPRMKTYNLGGKEIYGYRNFLKARRTAKLNSGGFKIRNDGSVVPRNFRPRVGRLSTAPLNLPQPAAIPHGVTRGQCRDGTIIVSGTADWGCRHSGGTGWSAAPARIQGVRDY